MIELNKKQSTKGEKTLLISLLLSAELIALFVSWWIYRKLQRSIEPDDAYSSRMERLANLTVALAMLCSGTAMLVVGVTRLFVYRASGNVIMGLIIAVLGVLTNVWFWWRYGNMTQEGFDAVIAGQQKLYRAKSSVDLCVVIALTTVVAAPGHPATRYIDALGCIIVAGYLLYNGLGMIRQIRAGGSSVDKDISELN